MLKDFEIIDISKDNCTRCVSVMMRIKVKDYLEAVKPVFEERQGGMPGQRPTLSTKVAKQIRDRMVNDLAKGAIFPPIVTGLLLPSDLPAIESRADYDTLLRNNIPGAALSIIDGMQRTTALMEVLEKNQSIGDDHIRVESWIAHSIDSLIYRMLVLNTGQIPWTLKRQMEVVFRRDIEALKQRIPGLMLYTDDSGAQRRKNPGEYQANQFLELFLAFGMRHDNINIQDQLIDEFAKLDFIEASASSKMSDNFVEIAALLVSFDKAFAKYEGEAGEGDKFASGADLFSKQPARIGFIVAMSQYIMGKLGNPIPLGEQQTRAKEAKENAERLLASINTAGYDIGSFLDFETLSQVLPQKTSRVGERARKFFTAAFEELAKSKFQLPSLTQCWRVAQRA